MGRRAGSMMVRWLVMLGVVTAVVVPMRAQAGVLVAQKASGWRYFKGDAEPTPLDRSAWRTNGFDDGSWSSGQAPIGYGETWINTSLGDMRNGYSTLFMRRTFTVADPSDVVALHLQISFDDGFIAWINGKRVRDVNEPATTVHYALSTEGHESSDEEAPTVQVYATYPLSLDPDDILDLLVPGTNVLAVQGFNQSTNSSDFVLDAALLTAAADTKFSHDRGFYSSTFTVTIQTATPGATIKYTTDGSRPTTTHGTVVAGTNATVSIPSTRCLRAAAFRGGDEPTDIDTQTYIFLEDVIEQPNVAPAGTYVFWDTVMDPNIVDAAAYSNLMIDAMLDIPTISIVADDAEMFGSEGIHRGDNLKQYEWEIPCSMELVYPTNYPRGNFDGFQVNCGIKIQGGGGRWSFGSYDPKQSFGMRFRAQYGAPKLNYPMFEDAPLEAESAANRYDKLILRAGHNKSWSAGIYQDNDPRTTTYARDEFGRALQISMSGVGSHGMFAHLYINGLYWGLYNPCERLDHDYSATYLGGDEDAWYSWKNKGGTVSGTSTRFDYWRATAASSSDFALLESYVAVDVHCDWVVSTWYLATGDLQYYMGNCNNPAGPVYVYAWDLEDTIVDITRSGVNPEVRTGCEQLTDMFNNNSDYRTRLADAVYRAVKPGGLLTDELMTNRWKIVCDHIDLAIIGESARWGDQRKEPPYTRDGDWYWACNDANSIILGNDDDLVTLMRANAWNGRYYYPNLDPPTMSADGGEVVSGFQLVLSNPNASGTLYYTIDGSDPRKFYTGLNNVPIGDTAQQYGGAITITNTTHVKARIKKASSWSAVNEATFNVAFAASDLRLTEIMYKPQDQQAPFVEGKYFEFLEFKNIGGGPVDLSGFYLGGVDFTFPPGTTVDPGDFLLVVRSMTDFVNRHGSSVTNSTQTFQWTDGGLSDNGEKIRLRNSDSNTVLSCEYNDAPPWPLGPDASEMGRSLVNTNPGGDPDNPKNWRASTNVDGSPGADDPAPGYGLGVIVNEVQAHTDDAKGDKIELYNSGPSSVNISGWYLSDAYDPGAPEQDYKLKKWQIPSVTIPAGQYYVFYETNHSPAFGMGFQLHEWGDQVYLSSASGGNLNGYIVGAEFGASESQVGLGRYETSVGEEDFLPAMSSWTPSNANSAPKVGPIVINEIMYNPPETGSCTNEFIELLNITGSPVDISGWDVEGAGNYQFPTTTVIQANNYLVLLDTNSSVSPAVFRSTHSIPGGVPIHGHSFDLGNNGEAIRLEKLNDDPDTNATDILVDRVRYNDRAPWPTEAAGEGPSLERYVAGDYGNEPLNWRAHNNSGTPGAANSFISGMAVHDLSNWRYHDKGLDLGTAWQELDYSDSGWDDGDGVLGYRVGDNSAFTTVLSYGPNASAKYPTYYFRKEFTIAEEPGDIQELKLHARYDDGFVAYINGQEVQRGGMPTGTVSFTTLAPGPTSGGGYTEYDISAQTNALMKGRNVLAVEVHQINATSSDVEWDARLTYDVSSLPNVTVDISPDGGSFTDPIDVTITASPTNATIYYTTDGSEPDSGDAQIDSGDSIQLAASATVRARGELTGYDAGTDSATFTHTPRMAFFSAGSSNGEEEAGTVNLAVELSTTSGGNVMVNYEVDGSSTASGSDYTLAAGILTIPSGQLTRNIALTIKEDTQEEPDETVVVALTSAAGADIGAPSNHTYTILDDDGPMQQWVAYNDLLWAATDPTYNITLVSPWNEDGMTNVDELVDFATGSGVGVTLSVAQPGVAYNDGWRTQGGNANSGTDAYTNFNGVVGCLGSLSYDTNIVITLTGMNPDRLYTLVVFGNRNDISYEPGNQNRTSEYMLWDVDSFVNDSTPGTTILQNSVPDDTTKYCSGYNTVVGYVARFTNIRCGSDGDARLTVQEGTASHEYANALRLECWRTSGTSETTKIAKGSTWKYRKGNSEASDPATDWRRLVFDDSGWSSGPAPIGYKNSGGGMGTSLDDMYNSYSSISLRQEFSVDSPSAVEKIRVSVDFDDGFIAWINGDEILRLNVGGNPGDFVAYDSLTPANSNGSTLVEFEGQALPALQQGTNVMAIQVFNRSLDSSDCNVDAQLSVVEGSFLFTDDDADNDELHDGWETATCPGGDGNPATDYDFDGLNTLQEYVAGTHPNQDTSFFALGVDQSGAEATISFDTIDPSGVTGYSGMTRHYALEQRLDLSSAGIWSAVPGYADVPAAPARTVTHTNPPGQNIEYYRARVWLE